MSRGMQNVFLDTRKNKSFGKDHNKLEINNPKEKKKNVCSLKKGVHCEKTRAPT